MIDANKRGKKARSEQKQGSQRQLLEYEQFASYI